MRKLLIFGIFSFVLSLGFLFIPAMAQVTPRSGTENFKESIDSSIQKIKDPFYVTIPQRVFLYSKVKPTWWVGSEGESGYSLITFESLDSALSGRKRSFYVPFTSMGSNGVEMSVMNGTVVGSAYRYTAGTLKKSDDLTLYFPSQPQGELVSPVKVTSNGVERKVYVPQEWWKD